eukprot:CAMPEP_0170591916 /NCGR_PEP_ID=MMETSP0224-20130122/12658_1 /TAXON_ID=285029 /ORGANISM="Togula jolla, Strain CCCM 725" /LENGTH=354 /DNA_ID=CAMNT_0010915811 /DNA_START=107 /DNA_END=1171 /DNA_ORIENTATION=+
MTRVHFWVCILLLAPSGLLAEEDSAPGRPHSQGKLRKLGSTRPSASKAPLKAASTNLARQAAPKKGSSGALLKLPHSPASALPKKAPHKFQQHAAPLSPVKKQKKQAVTAPHSHVAANSAASVRRTGGIPASSASKKMPAVIPVHAESKKMPKAMPAATATAAATAKVSATATVAAASATAVNATAADASVVSATAANATAADATVVSATAANATAAAAVVSSHNSASIPEAFLRTNAERDLSDCISSGLPCGNWVPQQAGMPAGMPAATSAPAATVAATAAPSMSSIPEEPIEKTKWPGLSPSAVASWAAAAPNAHGYPGYDKSRSVVGVTLLVVALAGTALVVCLLSQVGKH